MYGKQYPNFVLELNASDERGIDVVREQIKEFASTKQIFSSGFKLIILDEADNMTKDAQNALRRVIEKYTQTTRFCLICNYVNKIIDALQSRCTKFRFSPLTKLQMKNRLNEICRIEKCEPTPDGLDAIATLSLGDMRKALMILQSTYMSFAKQITAENVYLCTGSPLRSDIHQMLSIMLGESTISSAFEKVYSVKEQKGYALSNIIKDIQGYIIKLKVHSDIKIFIFDKLSEIEWRLSFGANEKLQLAAMIGIFQLVRRTSDNVTIQELASRGNNF